MLHVYKKLFNLIHLCYCELGQLFPDRLYWSLAGKVVKKNKFENQFYPSFIFHFARFQEKTLISVLNSKPHIKSLYKDDNFVCLKIFFEVNGNSKLTITLHHMGHVYAFCQFVTLYASLK